MTYSMCSAERMRSSRPGSSAWSKVASFSHTPERRSLACGDDASLSENPSGTLEITDDRVFGPGSEALARRFAQRVLAFTEIQSLALDPTRARAPKTIDWRPGDPGVFLTQLADAATGPTAEVNETKLPHWTDASQSSSIGIPASSRFLSS